MSSVYLVSSINVPENAKMGGFLYIRDLIARSVRSEQKFFGKIETLTFLARNVVLFNQKIVEIAS